MERALSALRTTTPESSEDLTKQAAKAVWAYFVQRELCGLRDHSQIIAEMDIPAKVLRRLGEMG